MTVRELYDFAIEKGLEMDPRGREAILRDMEEVRAGYELLSEREKLLFDTERFANPFGDTRIVCGDPRTQVRRLICGINITAAEVLVADRLRDHGRPVDLVVAHHASAPGGGLGSRRDTGWPQVQMMTDFGVPEHLAHKLVRPLTEGDQRSYHYEITQVAEALGMPFMTIHSPADIYLFHEGRRILEHELPRTVGDLVDICDSWPEVRWLIERGKGTTVAVGDKRDPLGKCYFAFYGGWNPSPAAFEAICDAGCGTLWVVDTSPELNEIAARRHVSIVVVPHCPADNVGLNMFFDDAMDQFGDFEVINSSNYVRCDRRLGR